MKSINFLLYSAISFMALLGLLFLSSPAFASPATVLEKQSVIIVGDRSVDIAYNLGFLPQAMSVRCTLWPLCDKIKATSQLLGCPGCLITKRPKALPRAVKSYGTKMVIIEHSVPFCIYKPKISPMKSVKQVQGMDTAVKYVDFRNGIESAIRQMASLLGREASGEALVKKYQSDMLRMESRKPDKPLGKKVVVLNCLYQAATGKYFIRVEAPGGYSDKYLLSPLGCSNVGASLYSKKAKVGKGHVLIRHGKVLADINPDVIIFTGQGFAGQLFLARELKKHPELKDVTALKNRCVFSLPRYVDSGVIEYPSVFAKWQQALNQ